METEKGNWISPASISTNLIGQSKKEIFEELSVLLEQNGKVNDRQKLLEDICVRDSVSNTFILNGIAIPHAKSSGVSGLCAAIGIKKPGILIHVQEKNQVSVFIMVAWQENTPACLKRIAALTDILNKRDSLQFLLSAENPEKIFNYVAAELRKTNAL